MERYYAVQNRGIWEQVIDKSRFIGIIYPVTNLVEIEQARQDVRLIYPGARHYVYAYRLTEGSIEKSSDDGEPQGTGGRPVLEVLQHREVWDVLLVMVRYFGGILLGTGGLIRAYGGTAKQLLDNVNLILLIPYVRYRLKIPYSWYEKIKYHLQFHPLFITSESFREYVEAELSVPETEGNQFSSWLEEFTAGQVSGTVEGVVWQADPEQ